MLGVVTDEKEEERLEVMAGDVHRFGVVGDGCDGCDEMLHASRCRARDRQRE